MRISNSPPQMASGVLRRDQIAHDEVSPQDRVLLQARGNQYRQERGVLLTPPLGKLKPSVQGFQSEVEEMVERLAGQPLREMGFQVLVNLYSKPEVNAFAASAHKQTWGKQVASQSESLLTYLGESQDRSVVELGLEVGLLRQLKNLDELAFVLGHELGHLLAGDISQPQTATGHWINSQAQEALADAKGLQLMTEAGYNPQAGLDILERLFEGYQYPEDPVRCAFSSFATSHHHEGVRLALAQAKCEQLQRQYPESSLLLFQTLPESVPLQVPPRAYSNCTQVLKQVLEPVVEHFLESGESEAVCFAKRTTNVEICQMPKGIDLSKLRKLSPSPDNLGQVYGDLVAKIAASSASPQSKINTSLLLYQAMASLNSGVSPCFDCGQKHNIRAFLLENSQGWRLDHFEGQLVSSTSRAYGYSLDQTTTACAGMAKKVLLDSAFQELIQPLLGDQFSGSHQWKALLSKAPQWLTTEAESSQRESGQPHFPIRRWDSFKQALPQLSDSGSQLGLPQALESFLKQNAEVDQQIKQSDLGFAQTLLLLTQGWDKKSHQERQALQGLLGRYQDFGINQLEHLAKSGDNLKLVQALQNFSTLDSRLSWKPKTKERLRQIIGVVATGAVPSGSVWQHFPTLAAWILESSAPPEQSLEYLRRTKAPLANLPRGKHQHPKVCQRLSEAAHRDWPGATITSQVDWEKSLDLLGYDRTASAKLAQSLSWKELQSILSDCQSQQPLEEITQAYGHPSSAARFSCDGGVFLMDTLVAHQSGALDFRQWHSSVEQILGRAPETLNARANYRPRLEKALLLHFEAMEPEQRRQALGSENIRSILSAEKLAQTLVDCLSSRLPRSEQKVELHRLFSEVMTGEDRCSEWYLRHFCEQYPLAGELFKMHYSEVFQVQPQELAELFPQEQERTEKEWAYWSSSQLKALSGTVALTRGQPAPAQIEMLAYLSGRQEEPPSFLDEVADDLARLAPVGEIVRDLRSQLLHGDITFRTLALDSLLAGPSSLLSRPQDRELLFEMLLAKVQPERRALARSLAESLLESQGTRQSLSLAFVLAQRTSSGEELSEGEILHSLFAAHGTPGIKFEQHLAFTEEFKEFRTDFERSQDQAAPLNYYQAIQLLEHQFGEAWDPRCRVLGVLGSGSVNVAIEYLDAPTQERRVMVVARENIENATKRDFIRIERFVERLQQDPQDGQRYAYLQGLLPIIRAAVNQEFDKTAAALMQQKVQDIYQGQQGGWKIGTVAPYACHHQTIFMEKALGETARAVYEKDPTTYRQAMGALAEVEFAALRGVKWGQGAKPIPLHANPDFHDGQALIAREQSQPEVRLLDFGQAVPISNQQRESALNLLSVIGKSRNAESARRLIASEFFEDQGGPDTEEIRELYQHREPMDRFVRLIALLGQHGYEVPLPVVNWIVAIHRQDSLGQKVGIERKRHISEMVLAQQLGLGLETFNRLYSVRRDIAQALTGAIQALRPPQAQTA